MTKLLNPAKGGDRYDLHSPKAMPSASAFLWNRNMLLQLNCRGYAVAQHLQPEISKYSHAPVLEESTFMQPELPLYAHHPGRYVYISDADSGELYSMPHEPVRNAADEFVFSAGKSDVEWRILHSGISTKLSVALPVEDVVELWTLTVSNTGDKNRRLNIYPYFTIGYMSWMNQSAEYRKDLGGIVASSVAPYQKLEDHAKISELKSRTVFLHNIDPDSWETNRDAFEGEGGIKHPDAISLGNLANGDARYETPVATLHYGVELAPGETREFRFLFGPARTDEDVRSLRDLYLVNGGFEQAASKYAEFLSRGTGCIRIETPDSALDNFVNHWLGRQVYYHGDANRLTTDPQTRNYLQDSIGMVFVDPATTRKTIHKTLSQQKSDGALPEGILLNGHTELKYINQIPHTDHCLWLPITLKTYLDETANFSFLDETVDGDASIDSNTVLDRGTAAVRWLINNRDERGLSLIAQGDWCDPMNMVGHKGKGISGWLTIASVHALNIWKSVCEAHGRDDLAAEMQSAAHEFTAAAQKYLWDGDWFARGITDDGTPFGISTDTEGKIFLNPQSWALLSDVATPKQKTKITAAVDEHLSTPFGAMLLAPSYTAMRKDVGRITQKHPGSAENGSIYNHASTFYIHALYAARDSARAYEELRKMIPGPTEEDYVNRGQLPVFVPNYYRGAVHQFPRTAGRSSQLFNTGAASWLYRAVIEELFGLKGCSTGLQIDPQLPPEWEQASAVRSFRGATFNVTCQSRPDITHTTVAVDGEIISDGIIRRIEAGREYEVHVKLPKGKS